MKKSLILSTCILTLTTTPLFASQHDDLEDASNVARQQLAMSQFEEQKRTAGVAKLQRLLSTPNADLEEIASLPFDLQIEYADRRSAQEQQQAVAMTPMPFPGRAYVGAPQASVHERELIEKVETLISLGEWAPLADINSLPTTYFNMYQERLRAAQEESQQCITSASPMPNMVESSRRPAAAQVTSPQILPSAQHLPSSTASSSLPAEEINMAQLEEQFARAALMAEQSNDFALAESVDMRKDQLRRQIAQRGERIAQATVHLQALDQQLGPIQALVSEKDTTIARIRQLTDLAQGPQTPINPRFQSRVDELNLQIPANYAELKREFETLTASLETERASQASAQEELTSLSTH